MHIFDAVNKAVFNSLRLSDNLYPVKPLEDFFPDNAELCFADAIAKAAVNTKAKGHVFAWIAAINLELIGIFESELIPVSAHQN